MVTPDLIKYLEDCEKMGVKKEQAMTALLAAGWKLPHIQEALKIMDARATPMNRPRIIFPTFKLSMSLLLLLVVGTSTTVIALNFAANAPLDAGTQANVTEGVSGILSESESESALIESQINTVSAITDSLEVYKELSGRYPSDLKDLKKTGNQIITAQTASDTITTHNLQYLTGLYGERPLYEKDFVDVFTKSNFLYGPTAEGYSLSYLLRWNNPQSSVIENQFVNGWNTATPQSLSTFRDE